MTLIWFADNGCNQAKALKCRLLSIQLTSEAFETGQKMSDMGMFQQPTPLFRSVHDLQPAPVVFQKESSYTSCGKPKGVGMKTRADIQQGTLALMVLKTLDVLGPLHGYGIARRIEQISANQLALNQGTLYPLLLRLEQEGAIASEWGPSENNRRARFYRLMRAGRKQLQAELRDWQQTAEIIARFLAIKEETRS
jgi:PadR family transcriptional regulator PadR